MEVGRLLITFSNGRTATIGGVIFDMDGTLTKPVIDFKKMRDLLGIPKEDVLTVVGTYGEEERKKAMKIIEDVEEEGRTKFEFNEGVFELMKHLEQHNVHRSILTRNSSKGNHIICRSTDRNDNL